MDGFVSYEENFEEDAMFNRLFLFPQSKAA